MYQPSTLSSITAHAGRTVMIYGLSAGTALGLAQCILYGYGNSARYSTLSKFSGLFGLLLLIGGFLLIGALAGKRTGKMKVGTLAGLWASTSGGIILAILTFMSLISFSEGYLSYSFNGFVALYLSLSILSVIVWMGIGTGLGALGGLIGQSLYVPAQATAFPHADNASLRMPEEPKD